MAGDAVKCRYCGARISFARNVINNRTIPLEWFDPKRHSESLERWALFGEPRDRKCETDYQGRYINHLKVCKGKRK